MNHVDTLHDDRYWSEVSCCTIMTHLGDLDVKVIDLEILCLRFYKSMLVDIGLKLYVVPS